VVFKNKVYIFITIVTFILIETKNIFGLIDEIIIKKERSILIHFPKDFNYLSYRKFLIESNKFDSRYNNIL